MFSSICNILRISVSAYSVITLRHSLLMQPHHFAIATVRSSLWGNHACFSYPVLCLSSFCGTRKEVRMEIRKAISFYHSQVKYVTLQELLTNNTRSLIRDPNKISKHSPVIKTSINFELSCTICNNIKIVTSALNRKRSKSKPTISCI